MSQSGEPYVEIPGGSNYYIYHNGEDIEGWSEAEFAALIGGVLDEIEWRSGERDECQQAFANHFGGWDESYKGGITPPERGYIFCQCVDRRIDGIRLTDDLLEAVREWVDEFDTLYECANCGKEHRPVLYAGEPYYCDDDECQLAQTAEIQDVEVENIKKQDQVFYELYNNYGYGFERAHELSYKYIMAVRS